MPKILIDGDVLLYQVTHQTCQKTDWGDGRWTYEGDENAAVERFRAFLEEIAEAYPAWSGPMVIPFSVPTAALFRRDVYAEYKGNRDDADTFKKPPHFTAVKERVLADPTLNTFQEPNLEGDDLLGIYADEDDLILTIDKDLHTVPAYHVNMQAVGAEPRKVSRAEAYRFFLKQTLMGDRVDNIPGAKGVGPVTAEKILDSHQVGNSLWEHVVAKGFKGNEDEALMNARLTYILQHEDDYNFETKEVRLWTPK